MKGKSTREALVDNGRHSTVKQRACMQRECGLRRRFRKVEQRTEQSTIYGVKNFRFVGKRGEVRGFDWSPCQCSHKRHPLACQTHVTNYLHLGRRRTDEEDLKKGVDLRSKTPTAAPTSRTLVVLNVPYAPDEA